MESVHLSDPLWVSQRLDRLEQAHRRLKRVVMVGLLGLAALGVTGQTLLPKPKVVEAQEFITRDSAGRKWATLGLGSLTLFDSAGNSRVILNLFLDGRPYLSLLDSAGEVQASLATLKNGLPSLYLRDSKGKWRTELGLGSLKLSDDSAILRAALGEVELEAIATGGVEQRPASSLVLFNRTGTVIWKAP